ncbi:MAG: twin-arginine translocase TatA/TatE family subunit [Chloroflexota bacterium]|nr:twin-arginine translocase TatA/TatE family subunit [Chloroflexota bacterium]
MSLGPTELILILLIVVVLFGAGKLSQVGGALGKSIREFRDASESHTETTTTTTQSTAATPIAPATTNSTTTTVVAPDIQPPTTIV